MRRRKVERAVVTFTCIRCKLILTVRFRGYPGQSRRSMFRRCWSAIKTTYEDLGWRKLDEGWVCGRCTGIRGPLLKKAVAEDVRQIQDLIEKLTKYIDSKAWDPVLVSYATLALIGMSIGITAEDEEELKNRIDFACNDIQDLARKVFNSVREEDA